MSMAWSSMTGRAHGHGDAAYPAGTIGALLGRRAWPLVPVACGIRSAEVMNALPANDPAAVPAQRPARPRHGRPDPDVIVAAAGHARAADVRPAGRRLASRGSPLCPARLARPLARRGCPAPHLFHLCRESVMPPATPDQSATATRPRPSRNGSAPPLPAEMAGARRQRPPGSARRSPSCAGSCGGSPAMRDAGVRVTNGQCAGGFMRAISKESRALTEVCHAQPVRRQKQHLAVARCR
jgi:hypothetical protein